jgi:hypothetical protein
MSLATASAKSAASGTVARPIPQPWSSRSGASAASPCRPTAPCTISTSSTEVAWKASRFAPIAAGRKRSSCSTDQCGIRWPKAVQTRAMRAASVPSTASLTCSSISAGGSAMGSGLSAPVSSRRRNSAEAMIRARISAMVAQREIWSSIASSPSGLRPSSQR